MSEATVLLHSLQVDSKVREATRLRRNDAAFGLVNEALEAFATAYLAAMQKEHKPELALSGAGKAGLEFMLKKCPQADDSMLDADSCFQPVKTTVCATEPDARTRLILQNAITAYTAGIRGIEDSAELVCRTKQYFLSLGTTITLRAIERVTFADIAGNDEAKQELMSIAEDIRHAAVFEQYGLNPLDSSVLLAGPPGCGKTYMVKAFANEAGMPFHEVRIPDVLSCMYGKSSQNIRRYLDVSGVVFLDEIDALGRSRSIDTHEATASLVATMCAELDGIGTRHDRLFIAATNIESCVDPALRRPPRLSKIIRITQPNPVDLLVAFHKHRAKYEQKVRVFGQLDNDELSHALAGCSFADVAEIVKRLVVSHARQSYNALEPELLAAEDVIDCVQQYERKPIARTERRLAHAES